MEATGLAGGRQASRHNRAGEGPAIHLSPPVGRQVHPPGLVQRGPIRCWRNRARELGADTQARTDPHAAGAQEHPSHVHQGALRSPVGHVLGSTDQGQDDTAQG